MKKTIASHRRHDISDETWALLEPHLPGHKGVWGGIAEDNRLFIDAVFWILRTGAPWRDLLPTIELQRRHAPPQPCNLPRSDTHPMGEPIQRPNLQYLPSPPPAPSTW